MKKALVAGHICLDITPVFAENAVSELTPGKLLNVGAADIHPGGLVSNTGLAMHFFGADVELLAKVGNDEFGKVAIKILEKSGVSKNIKVSGLDSTSYSVVIARPGVDRIFLHCPGTNDTFASADITEADIQDKAIVHFGYPTLMRKMYENEGAELIRIFKMLKACGKVTSLDLSAVDAASDAGKADWQKILSKVLPYVDFFLPSYEELCFMLDREKYDSFDANKDICTQITIEDVRQLAKNALNLGASFVMVKTGAAGMYHACGKDDGFVGSLDLNPEEWLGQEGFEKSYKPGRICSGTGAGDTAIAAFLSCVLRGYSAQRSIRLAAAAGASCVAAYDAVSGLKPLDEMERKIDDGWAKQNLIEE